MPPSTTDTPNKEVSPKGFAQASDSPGTMENSVIFLPTTKDGVISLGDLWDCRSSTAVGNLFDKALTADDIDAHPVSTLVYDLKRVKTLRDMVDAFYVSVSLSLEAMGGAIKFAGKASFDRDDQKKFHEEMILCNYEAVTFAVRLKHANAMSAIVRDNLVDGVINATHYVDTVYVGGQAQASIKYYENIDKSHLHLTGELSGTLSMGPVTASAKASIELLDTEYAENISTLIDIKAQPSISSAPTTCEQMFKEVENIAAAIEAQQHYPFLEKTVYGVPIRFRLLPLNRIIDMEVDQLYNLMKEDLLNAYSDMLITLEEFRNPEHIKSLLREELPSITPILVDERHPITQELLSWGLDLSKTAEELKLQALKLFADYKIKQATELELTGFMKEEYDIRFPLPEIIQKIQNFKTRSRNDLNGVRIPDSGEGSKVTFFTNSSDKLDWYSGDRTVKILLETAAGTTSSVAGGGNGTFTKLYDLSPLLSSAGAEVGLAFPTSSSDFCLRFKTSQKEVIFKDEDIPGVLNVLEVLLNRDARGKAASLFHAVNLDLAGVHGMNPLTPELVPDFHSLYTLMKRSLGEENSVLFCESHCDLLTALGSSMEDVWNLVVPIVGLATAEEQIIIFKRTYQSLKLAEENNNQLMKPKTRWIFSAMNVSSEMDSAPMIFAFKGDTLTAICKDGLDVAIFLHQLLTPNGGDLASGSGPFSPSQIRISPLYTDRANFALQLMPQVLLAHTSNVWEPLEESAAFRVESNPQLDAAIQVITGGLRSDSQLFSRVSKLASASSSGTDGSNQLLDALLQSCGFADGNISSAAWSTADWESISNKLESITKSGSIPLTKIAIAREQIDRFQIKDPRRRKIQAEDDDENEDGDNYYNDKLNRLINELIAFLDQDEEFNVLKQEVDKYPAENYLEDAITRKRKIAQIFDVFLDASVSAMNQFHLEQLLFLSNQMKSVGSFAQCMPNFFREYVNQVTISDEGQRERVMTGMDEGSWFKVLQLLSGLRAHPLLHEVLHTSFQEIGRLGIPCPALVKGLLESLTQAPFTEEQLEAIWLNPSFLYLIRVHLALQEAAVISGLIQYFKHFEDEGDGAGIQIPYYIPADISEKVKPLLNMSQIMNPFPWEEKWASIKSFEEQLQKFIARSAIPQKFMSIFLINLNHNETLKQQLQEAKCLFHFDLESSSFIQPWSLITVIQALERLEAGRQQKSEMTSSIPCNYHQNPFESEDQGSTSQIQLKEDWHPFTQEGKLGTTNYSHLMRIDSPKLITATEYHRMNHSLENMLKTIQLHLKSWNPSGTEAATVFKMINYPTYPFYGDIDFDQNRNQSKNDHRISRGDLITALIHSIEGGDPLMLHTVLSALAEKSDMALPLLISNIENATTDGRDGRKTNPAILHKWLYEAWQTVVLSRSKSYPIHGYVLSPFSTTKLIITLRAGDTPFGRSSLINRHLMRNKNAFGSANEPGSEIVAPIARAGMVEFIPLTEQSCFPPFWNMILNGNNNVKTEQSLCLAVLHGNVLDLEDDILQTLIPFASCLFVFWAARNWNELRNRKKALDEKLVQVTQRNRGKGLHTPMLDVILYPDVTISNHVNQENLIHKSDDMIDPKLDITDEEININTLKLCNVFKLSLEYPPPSRLISVEPIYPSTVLPLRGINTPAASALMKFVKETTINKIKNALKSPMDLSSPILVKLITLFSDVLREFSLATENPLQGLVILKQELELESKIVSQEWIQLIEKLRAQIEDGHLHQRPSDEWVLGRQEELKFALEQYNQHVLLPGDLFKLTSAKLIDGSPDEYHRFLEIETKCIVSGFPVEFLSPSVVIIQSSKRIQKIQETIPSVFPTLPALRRINPNTRIFVVSILGLKSSGKSTLLNRLFGPNGFTEILPSSGVVLRMHWLTPDLRDKLKCDAFLVLDTEGIGAAENKLDNSSDALERMLASWILSMSDLTLVNLLGPGMGELITILQVAFFSLTQIETISTLNNNHRVILTQQNVPNQTDDHNSKQILKLRNVLETVELKTGRDARKLGTIYRDIILDQVGHKIRPKSQPFSSSTPDYSEDVQNLYSKILNRCSETQITRTSLGEWLRSCITTWESLMTPSFFSHNLTNEALLVLAEKENVRNSLFDVKDGIATAIRTHEEEILPRFVQDLEIQFEDFTPGFDSRLQNLLLGVEQNLGQLVDSCQGLQTFGNKIKVAGSASCLPCRSAFMRRESLASSQRGLKRSFLFDEEIQNYAIHTKLLVHNRLSQLLLTKQIRERKSEELKAIVKQIVEEFGADNGELVFSKFHSHISSRQKVIPSAELLKEEILQIYTGVWNYKFKQLFFNEGSEPSKEVDLDSKIAFQGVDPCLARLDEKESTWLKLNLRKSTDKVIQDFVIPGSKLYQPGMARALKASTETRLEMLEEFAQRWSGNLASDFKFNVHLYAFQIIRDKFEQEQMSWDEHGNPIIALREHYDLFVNDPVNFFMDFDLYV